MGRHLVIKGFLTLLAGLLVACVVAFLALPYLVPASVVRDVVAARVEGWTGQRLTFGGPVELGVFPSLRIDMRDVSLAPANGVGEGALLSVDVLSGRVRLWPLLFGEVQVDEFTLARPRLALHVAADGTTNWQLPASAEAAAQAVSPDAGEAPAVQPEQAGRPEQAAGPDGAAPRQPGLREVRLGAFTITDGRVTLTDERGGGDTVEASDIAARITWPSLAEPVKAAGGLVWNGQTVEFEASASDALRLASGGQSEAVSLRLSSAPLQMALSGSASTLVDPLFNGTLDATIPSLRALAQWAGVALPDGPGLDALRLRGQLVAGAGQLSFSQSSLTLDGNPAEGALIVKVADDGRPSVQATLAFDTLNLNPYLGDAAPAPQPAPEPAPQPQPQPAGQPAQAQAQAPAPDWLTEPIDLSALRGFDADIRLSAQKIAARHYDLGGAALSVALQGGRLTANVAELAGYGGRLTALVGVDASGAVPAVSLNLNAKSIALQPFLKDMVGMERLSGTGDVAVDVASHGPHQAAMAANLTGKAQISAGKGQISGIDAAAILSNVQKGQLSGWAPQDGAATTVFDRFQASFDIAAGAAVNEDLLLESPVARVSGSGRLNLVEQSLDFRLRGALLRGGGEDAPADAALEIPFIARGPWSAPMIYPDAEELLKSPAVRRTLEDAVEALEKGDLRDLGKALQEGGGLNSLMDRLRGR